MREFLKSPNALSLGLLAARAPLGVFMLMAGFEKFATAGGVENFAQTCASVVPAWFPHSAAEQFFRVVPHVEIVVGASVLLGVATRLGGLLATVLLATQLILVTGVRATGQPFQSNLLLLGVALMVVLAGPGMFSMDQFMWTSGKDPRVEEAAAATKRQSNSLRVRFAGR